MASAKEEQSRRKNGQNSCCNYGNELGGPRKAEIGKLPVNYGMVHLQPAHYLDFAVQAGRFLCATLCISKSATFTVEIHLGAQQIPVARSLRGTLI